MWLLKLSKIKENKVHATVTVFNRGNDEYFGEQFLNENGECLISMNTNVNIPLTMCRRVPHMSPMVKLYKTGVMNDGTDRYEVMTNQERENFLRPTATLWHGKPIINIPLNIFIDDFSATKTKRWSPLHGIQAQVSGLPLAEKSRAKNVHFIAASETVTMMDLLKPVCHNIKQCKEHGVDAFDALSQREVVLTTDISLLVTDYHMMSLSCNHMGPSARKFCPKCFVDQSNPFERSEERTVEGTQRTLDLLKLRSHAGPRHELEKQTGIKLYDNCLWEHIDPHRDTPVGILHFLYLGLAKHLVQFCVKSLSSNNLQLLEIHLCSIDQSGFTYHINGQTFLKYLDSRQGKDFKHYLQIAPHNMAFAGLQQTYITALEKLSLISKHIQQAKSGIGAELQDYMDYIKTKIPELGTKKKTHFCLHIHDDIRRHGHPLNYIEDAFEKNHGPIRNSLQHQNGHARSRDTVIQFMKSELTKHLISGGFLKVSNKWTCAEDVVIRYGDTKKIRSYLGMTEEEEAGQLKNAVRTANRKIMDRRQALDELDLLMVAVAINTTTSNISKVDECRTVVASDGNVAHVGSFVMYHHNSQNHIGQFKRALEVENSGTHHTFHMAILTKANQANEDAYGNQRIQLISTREVVQTSNILHTVHAIHDCKHGKCRMVQKSRQRIMEQEQTTSTELFLDHNFECNIFIVNKFRLGKLPDKLCFI